MKFPTRIICAAAVATATFVYVPNVRAADEPAKTTAGQPVAHPLGLPAGIQVKDLNAADSIRSAFEDVTKAAFDKDIYDNVVNRLVDADRTRMGQWKDKDNATKDLQARVLTLQKEWKDKYGKDFDPDKGMVFAKDGFVAIAQGEIADPAQLIGHWPLAPVMNEGAQQASAKIPAAPADTAKQTRDAGKTAGGDTNLDKGRNVAVALYPASHNLPELRLSLIHELPNSWRFDIPDNMDGKMLHDNLLKHLNEIGDSSKWPTDMTEAYRMVGHHMLMAIYNVNESQMPAAH